MRSLKKPGCGGASGRVSRHRVGRATARRNANWTSAASRLRSVLVEEIKAQIQYERFKFSPSGLAVLLQLTPKRPSVESPSRHPVEDAVLTPVFIQVRDSVPTKRVDMEPEDVWIS